MLATGCANHSQAPGAAGNGQGNPYQQAVAFSKCMRSNGDPSFPDPGPGGAFPNENGSLHRDSPQFKKAAAACKKLEPAGPAQADFQKAYKRLLKYAACMRAHGMPDFPDPTLEDHGVGFSGNLHENSPQFKTANQSCRSLMGPDGS